MSGCYKVKIGDFMGIRKEFYFNEFDSKDKALAHATTVLRIGESVLSIEVSSYYHLLKMLKFTSWRMAEYRWARERGLGASAALEIARREK